MIGLDTNVLVRFLLRDDARQFERARQLIERESAAGQPVLISLPVLVETEWLLRSRYGVPKEEIVAALSGLLDAADVRIEDEPAVERALFLWRDSPAAFADCLIGQHYQVLGCSTTASFDARATRLPDFSPA